MSVLSMIPVYDHCLLYVGTNFRPKHKTVSKTGTVPHSTSKYLVNIIQPTLKINTMSLINAYSYKKQKLWKYFKAKYKSYNAVNLQSDKCFDRQLKQSQRTTQRVH